MTTALTTVSVSDVERMAVAVAKSNLFGVKTPEQAMSLMLIAQAEGMHPAIAARDYHIIDGKPALKADAMMARFQQAGGKVRWIKNENTEVSAEFSHPAGGTVVITWTMADAERAGFAGKQNWKKFPRQMLRSRVVSEGIRTVYPGVVIGVYTPEEVQDFDDRPVRNMGPVQTIEEPASKSARTAKPNKAADPKETELRDLAKTIQAEIGNAESIEEVNRIWADFGDGLDDIKGFSKTAYDHLEKAYSNRQHFLVNAPLDGPEEGDRVAAGV